MRIDIGIAANKNQPHQWWGSVLPHLMRNVMDGVFEMGQVIVIGSASAGFCKNQVSVEFLGGTQKLPYLGPVDTGRNRSAIAEQHLAGKADAIFWIDDDTVPPPDALEKLLRVDADIAAGVYFLRTPPYNPVVYRQTERGGYVPLFDYEPGEILTVDSVGMGCTLVHRRVYERIMDQYVLFRRGDTGTLKPVHRDDILSMSPDLEEVLGAKSDRVLLGQESVYRVQRLVPLEKPPARWPFYAMEYERTEDHWFNEMARRSGSVIAVDTSIECQHWGLSVTTGEDFRNIRRMICES